MCGRYASARSRIELLEEFEVERDRVSEPLEPDYNVAPTKRVYAVLTRRPRERQRHDEPTPRLRGARRRAPAAGEGTAGGPLGAGPVLGQGPVHRQPDDQRAGRDGQRQARRSAGRSRAAGACCPPTATTSGSRRRGDDAKAAKQPYFIYRGGRRLARLRRPVRALAGPVECPDDHPDAWLWTATIITTSAPDELGRDPRPDADGDRPGQLGGLARSRQQRRGRPAGAAGAGRRQRADLLPGVDCGQLGAQQRARA